MTEAASWIVRTALSSGVVAAPAVDDAPVDDPWARAGAPVGARLFLGRQGIFTRGGDVHGYEFLYRAGRTHGLRVDQWPVASQDRATLRVLQATFGPAGVQSVASDALAFVNFTRAFLVGDLPVPADPARLVVEVVESVRPDAEVVAGVARLRDEGFRIAIDDFIGLTGQCALLPYADYVKVDHRDLVRRGPALVDLARSHGAVTVAERIEDDGQLEECLAAGFDLLQGFHLERTRVLNRTPVLSGRVDRPVRDLGDARPRGDLVLTPAS